MRGIHISSPENGLQNTAISRQKSEITQNADFPDSFPLHLRPGGQGHNHSALGSASALIPQIQAGRNTGLSIDAGGTL